MILPFLADKELTTIKTLTKKNIYIRDKESNECGSTS